MKGYQFDVSCSHCGGELLHCNGAVHNATEAVAAVTCSSCRREFYITVLVRPFPRYKENAEYMRERRARVRASA